MKYALVHEWLTPKATGGSELVVQEILKHIDADLYALIDFESTNPQSYLYQRSIGTTFLQNLPFARNGVQKYLPLLPLAIEQLELGEYDVILSSSHAVAKGVLTSPQQLHICYCHTPMRYAWDLTFDYLRSSAMGQGFPGLITRYLLHRLRQWDVITANRVDYFIANSHHTARRIWRCYRRRAEVIYPPVNIERFPFQEEKEDFYLTVSRIVSYKQVSLIVQAFNQLGYPLVVIGDGSDLAGIRNLAHKNVKFLGFQPNQVVEQYMAKAKGFVYAACEDFGIALVEAQACGTPVIAYGAGGALETVLDIRQHLDSGTGLLFPDQSSEALIEAMETFETLAGKFNREASRLNAAKFAPNIFADRYLTFLEKCYQDYQF
ncbi:MAG: glycosyltransferase family 4 protein [Moorea sp. SIO1F2]|uniref:glycosyltransferase n=1 Tax=unclassified Moorena TaxID=2683338 RepID=UPI0013B8D693|nr:MULTISPECIES: glycosyltransferase [unclassified Moorena]NEO08559.1 glycosyltransferase family 4 protein [Moorena sp. SIO3I8]NEO21678.1 glycosyltransferase family 4 protein [Moorena sp. SIO4A5]NEP21981.1 glycosyltransferase family 4 protein [Moorena sp. SIO3I6]NEQ59313.1 glycosyltransferase family 4 protein [Moorena sp. SIO4A1]NET80591.1 glycosyltransferase family 4 protein [Moorena sp. SIO1F2]